MQNATSNPSPRTPETEVHASDVDAQSQADSLGQQLEAIDSVDPQSITASQEQRKRLSARDLLKRLNRRRLELSRINFTTGGTKAGKGSYGEVIVATLTLNDGTSSGSTNLVAVKKFLFGDNIDEEKFLRTFANELHVLDGLDHPNIIKLVGFVEDMKRRIAWLVFLWETNGNVREFLLSGKWELPERVSLMKDVASGLEYLHSRNPPIRHGDLKSLNIVVNSDNRAVITDFGSARILTGARTFETTGGSPHRQAAPTNSESNVGLCDGCPEVTISTTNAGLTLTGPSWSLRWAAPEVLMEEDPCLASDIWALGWIAWEIVTDNYPFPEAKIKVGVIAKVMTGVLPSLYDDVQLSQIGRLCDVMVRCWKSEPKERPSAAECRRAIQWVPSTIPRTRSDGTSQIRSAVLLVEMGAMHRLQSRHSEALKLLDDGISIARSAGDKETIAWALYLAADSHRMFFNYDMAEESCNRSLDIYTSIGDDLGRANALYRLAETHQERSNQAKAEESFNQALDIYRSVGHSGGRANAFYRLGQIHARRSNHAKAEESYNQALDIFTSLGENLGRANVLKGLGEIHQARSDHAAAEESFYQALAVYTSLGDSLGRANVFQRLGGIHTAQSNYAKAEESYNQALALFTTIGDSLGRANVLLLLGRMYIAQSNYAEAEESFNQSLALYTSIGRSLGRANSLLGLGKVLLRQARYSEAKSSLLDAAEVSNQINLKWAHNRSRELLAEVLEAEK